MLKPYLELQQQTLEQLGQERGQLREQWQREQQRLERLQQLSSALATPAGVTTPLAWQNRSGMQQQLRRLQAHQQQQLALANSDLQRHEALLRSQFGRVKGLEQLLSRREQEAQQRQLQAEQKVLDELAQRPRRR